MNEPLLIAYIDDRTSRMKSVVRGSRRSVGTSVIVRSFRRNINELNESGGINE